MHTYLHMCKHVCTQTSVCTYAHIHAYTHIRMYSTCTYTYRYVGICTYTQVQTIRTYKHLIMYMYTRVHTHMHRHACTPLHLFVQSPWVVQQKQQCDKRDLCHFCHQLSDRERPAHLLLLRLPLSANIDIDKDQINGTFTLLALYVELMLMSHTTNYVVTNTTQQNYNPHQLKVMRYRVATAGEYLEGTQNLCFLSEVLAISTG